uniref:Translation initiation factor eIF2B subunit alpha n=2 Tax=Plectus sambesii TaxID=2011161 RepID=A0A914W425_9BILA
MAPSTEDSPAGIYFSELLEKDASKSTALAAIETLMSTLEKSKATTVNELTDELKKVVTAMQSTDYSSTSVKSASELFMRFISLASLDLQTFDECMKVLKERGTRFIARVAESRQKIARFAQPFIKNNSRILTHSYSKVVLEALGKVAASGTSFHVFVTESRPDFSGSRTKERLDSIGIPCTLILDSAVGYLMESIDFVFVGAEGVMETGGIINKIGTLGLAICAKAMNKPVYVMTESIKFVKEYPLNQQDIPEVFKYRASTLKENKNLADEHPLVDYTPPQYIKLLFTDLGILTPAAVGDELIKLYL